MEDYRKTAIDDIELIVVKERALTKPTQGIVRIICIRNKGNDSVKSIDSQKYITGGLWISNGYEKIDENYKPNQLFVIDEHFHNTEDKPDQQFGHHDHWTFGDRAKPLKSNHMIPVVTSELPDKSTGMINIPAHMMPVTNIFFILDKNDRNHVYGPFKANIDNENITALPDQPLSLSLKQYHVLKVSLDKLKNEGIYVSNKLAILNSEGFIASLKLLKEKADGSYSTVDYINDTQLIDYFWKGNFGRPQSKNPVAKKAAQALREQIKEIQKKFKITADKERLGRLKKVLDAYLEKHADDLGIIDSFFNEKDGKNFLNSYIEKNRGIVEKYSTDYENKEREHRDKINELKRQAAQEEKNYRQQVEKAKKEAEEDIKKIKEKTAEEKQKELKKQASELEQEIEKKQHDLNELEKAINDLLGNREKAIEIKEMDGEITYLKRVEDDLKRSVKTQQSKLKSATLPEDITELKILLDILQGRSFHKKESQKTYQSSKITGNRIGNNKGKGKALIQSISEKFEDTGREFSFEETANLVISLQQSFLTVFKGLPGSGKTSTAIRIAKAYGLNDSDFLNVPVSRGWVSGRDFIGFYNSLKGNYQPAKTGIYQFLRNGNKNTTSSPIRLILLDEANLSPMEHYWSDFIALCDKESRSRKIDTGALGEDRYFAVGNNIRFLATINNDNTTEPLSPRLCDRATIISMDAPSINTVSEVQALMLDGAVDYADLEALFGRPDENDIEDSPRITDFCNKMTQKDQALGSPVMVSKRKQNAMNAFYKVACDYMEREYAEDFALSQHALPLINGYGKQFKQRLEELKTYTKDNGLSRTKELLEDIINNGEAYVDSYSFF